MKTGIRVEELAAERNLSLFKLSKLSGVGYSTLKSAKTRGTQLTVDTIEVLCKTLGISMAEFFSEVDDCDQTPVQLEGQLTLLSEHS